MEKVNEIWKPINGFEGLYEVSNTGLVRSMDRVIVTKRGVKKPLKGKILKPNMNDGYAYICLSKDGKELKYKAHRLVAEAFIPNPDNLPYINHKNECKSDNRVENLEWCTKWYNEHYGTFHEKSVTNLRKKLGRPICQYDMNGNFIREYACIVDTDKHGFCSDSVGDCCRGRLKQHRGYIFRYKQ